jgi:hypothetical protein
MCLKPLSIYSNQVVSLSFFVVFIFSFFVVFNFKKKTILEETQNWVMKYMVSSNLSESSSDHHWT